MKTIQGGFGGLQVVLVGAIIGATSLFAVPQYEAHVSRAKLTEAFRLAGESKRKLSEFYMVNGRLPQSTAEANALRTMTLSPAGHVRDVAVTRLNQGHEVVIKIFLKEGVVENRSGGEQYIYLAGREVVGGTYSLHWSCGASGVSEDLLPDDCAG